MKRREFTTLIGGALVWPLSALAQQTDRVRRIGVLMTLGADDPIAKARIAAFVERLQQLGWHEGANLEIDIRWNTTRAPRQGA